MRVVVPLFAPHVWTAEMAAPKTGCRPRLLDADADLEHMNRWRPSEGPGARPDSCDENLTVVGGRDPKPSLTCFAIPRACAGCRGPFEAVWPRSAIEHRSSQSWVRLANTPGSAAPVDASSISKGVGRH